MNDDMVEAGVAEKLDVPVYMYQAGNVVDTEAAYGRKCTHCFIHPFMCFVFDETPDTTCVVGDGQVGGRHYVTSRKMRPKL